MAKQSTTTTKRSGTNSHRRSNQHEDEFEFRELIQDREVESVFGALAIGFCCGLALGAALARPGRPQTWADRVAAEGIGKRVMETLDRILPNAISEKLYS